MKKFWVAFPAMIIAFVLSSCESEVHWGKYSTYVPWYVVWIPVMIFAIVVSVIAHICIIKQQYVCPKCGKVFKPKWYDFSSWIHVGDARVLRCPECKCKSFCRKHG